MLSSHRLMRMASAIAEQLTQDSLPRPCLASLTSALDQSRSLAGKLDRAARLGWMLAAARLRRKLSDSMARLRSEMESLECWLTSGRPRQADMRAIFDDLKALQLEFEPPAFDRKARTLSVTTDRIELQGIDLGPFRICLDWSQLADDPSYRVIALEPRPAASRDDVTHPHVQDEEVCEGAARQSIAAALEQGRLLDFFVIVSRLLCNYNSASPYVALSEWDGEECVDCGCMASGEHKRTCELCESVVCGGCRLDCAACDAMVCAECVNCCESCSAPCCQDCLKLCSQCKRLICPNCLQDNSERCCHCYEERQTQTADACGQIPASA
ncbi:MAG: hypothetical protein KDB14_26160 [Planctomycetales bacterium]|nr:hypothetical protein [Planctomycetales bacterium]